MPTYQYRCASCASELEVVQKFSDPALTECPSCPGELRKVFSAVGVVFKGSGFYATDSRTAGKTNAATPAAAAESKPGSQAKPAADAGPAAPAKPAPAASPAA